MKLKAARGFWDSCLALVFASLLSTNSPKLKKKLLFSKLLSRKTVLEVRSGPHCLKTMTTSKQSCIRLRIPESNKLQLEVDQAVFGKEVLTKQSYHEE